MNTIKEVMYVPTARCNYSCKHCGYNVFIKESEEVSCKYIADKLTNVLKKDTAVYVTGGEPFLKRDIEDFILTIVNNDNTLVKVHINTNGFFVKKIEDLLRQVKYPHKVAFSISIDALQDMHNEIRGHAYAYERALESLYVIDKFGIAINVNTVVQKDNLNALEAIKNKISDLFEGRVPHHFIPQLSDIGKSNDFIFTEKEVLKQLPYVKDTKDIKYLLSNGLLKISRCHAGLQNLLIAPNGYVYSCITGFFYFSNKLDNDFYLGDLKTGTVEQIVENRLTEKCQKAIENCKGCNSPCEVIREQKYFNLKIEFNKKEMDMLKAMIQKTEDNLFQWFDGWHEKECYEWGSLHWMSKLEARMLYKIPCEGIKKINISYINSIIEGLFEAPMTLTLTIGEDKVLDSFILGASGVLSFLLIKEYNAHEVVELIFGINHLWRPCDIQESIDNRELGIAICSVEVY